MDSSGVASTRGAKQPDMAKSTSPHREAEEIGSNAAWKPLSIALLVAFVCGGIVVLVVWARKAAELRKERLRLDFMHVPPVLYLHGWGGRNNHRMNGVFYLVDGLQQERPVWAKTVPETNTSGSYLLYDRCGAWLLSPDPTGAGRKCDGWAYAKGCRVPWHCQGLWKVFGGVKRGFLPIQEAFAVIPVWNASFMPKRECSADEEAAAHREFGSMDIIIPWINGSDPKWLEGRATACREWNRRWMWPDAMHSSPEVKRCLREKAWKWPWSWWSSSSGSSSSSSSSSTSACPASAGVDDSSEGGRDSCKADASTDPVALCFEEFTEEHCASRVKSIADHDELRYLLRSLEQKLQWHTGRIFLVAPRGQQPHWMREGPENLGRLTIVAQEELMERGMASEHYIKHETRGGPGGFAPAAIYNDFPVQNAYPFLPNVSRYVLLLDDDLVFARPFRACELFMPQPYRGVKVFADAYEPQNIRDPFHGMFRSAVDYTARLWLSSAPAAGNDTPQPTKVYYDPYHAPKILDMRILDDLWRRFPKQLSDTLDTPFRYPNTTDIIGLYHSELAEQTSEALQRSHDAHEKCNFSCELEAPAAEMSWVIDLREFPDHLLPPHKHMFFEIFFRHGTVEEWRRLMAKMPEPTPEVLPQLLSFQDHLITEGGAMPEVDCLRERWLQQLLPEASSFEDDSQPPDRCKAAERRNESQASEVA